MNKQLTHFLFLGLFLILSVSLNAQSVSINNLDSSDEQVVISTIQELGKQKNKQAIPSLIKLAKENKSIKVQIASISALGNMPNQNGEPTNSLAQIIQTTNNNEIVYAALLAMANLKDIKNENIVKVLAYCEASKMNDPFIKDIIEKVKALTSTKK